MTKPRVPSLYPLDDLYRMAVNMTPFLYRESYTKRRRFVYDRQDGLLWVARSSREDLIPVLTLRHEENPVTGMPRMVGDVAILDLFHRPVWKGVFCYTTRAWLTWEFLRYGNGSCRGDMMGVKDAEVQARLNSEGYGACLMYSSTNKWLGFDGVDNRGRLRYVLLSHTPFNSKVGRSHVKMGAKPLLGDTLPEVAFWPGLAPGPQRRRMTWTRDLTDYADSMRGVFACDLADGTLALAPRPSYKNPRPAGHTPLQEAFYLTGEDYAAIEDGTYERVNNNSIRGFYRAAEYVFTITREQYPDRAKLALAVDALTARSLAVPQRTIDAVLAKYGDRRNTYYFCPQVVEAVAPAGAVTIAAVPDHVALPDSAFFGGGGLTTG